MAGSLINITFSASLNQDADLLQMIDELLSSDSSEEDILQIIDSYLNESKQKTRFTIS